MSILFLQIRYEMQCYKNFSYKCYFPLSFLLHTFHLHTYHQIWKKETVSLENKLLSSVNIAWSNFTIFEHQNLLVYVHGGEILNLKSEE